MLLSHSENFKEFSKGKQSATSSNIFNVIKYIHDNSGKQISCSELSELCGFNKSYFSRYFKKWTGISVSNYIENVTMKAAKHLLVEENLSVKAVAAELGFSDQFTFSKKFKKHFGVAPILFKKINA